MKVKLTQIVFDETLRPRAQIDPITVHRFINAYRAGAKFPPVIIEDNSFRLVDGWSRCEAYRRLEITNIVALKRTYASDAELFADAIRSNVGHGLALQSYDLKTAIARLQEYGFERENIVEIVRIPGPKIDEIVRGFAHDEVGTPVPLKRGLEHLRDQPLNSAQVDAIRHHGGTMATFYARQLRMLIDRDMWPRNNPNFIAAMDDLTEAWRKIPRSGRAA